MAFRLTKHHGLGNDFLVLLGPAAELKAVGPDEARRWLGKATAWLDQYRDGMPDRADEELGLHLHNWLEAHVLRREAEEVIRPVGPH